MPIYEVVQLAERRVYVDAPSEAVARDEVRNKGLFDDVDWDAWQQDEYETDESDLTEYDWIWDGEDWQPPAQFRQDA